MTALIQIAAMLALFAAIAETDNNKQKWLFRLAAVLGLVGMGLAFAMKGGAA